MAYTPRTFSKNVWNKATQTWELQTRVSETIAEDVQLSFDGWSPNGPPPLPDPATVPVNLAKLNAEIVALRAELQGQLAAATPPPLDFMSSLGNGPGDAIQGGGFTTFTAANQAIIVKFRPYRDLSLNQLRWCTGSNVSGNYDIGIFTASGARLWSKGSAPWPAANTVISESVAPSVELAAGTDYLLAMAGDNVTGTWRGLSEPYTGQTLLLDGTQWARSVGSAFPLPSSLAPGSTRAGRIPMIVLGGE